MEITVHHFYPDLLNTYGDIGNILALKKRCKERRIEVKINNVHIGDDISLNIGDIVFIGGGQDFEQSLVVDDLLSKRNVIKDFIEENGCVLAICGGYQLLGKSYTTQTGDILEGLGILNIYTVASNIRKTGNIVIKNEENGETYIGFENHSGNTYINDHTPLGKCIIGFGNNGEDSYEGLVYKNTICTYMHGPLLPKNREITDRLISNCLKSKYQNFTELEDIDSTYEDKCKDFLLNRFNIK
ncbi:glutamine amidotransferase, CobB/CobQ family [Candidatus Arthromitus sp. SFB-mouse-Japan]|uniref:type 1 glutamine amidotransferase n=1 Tax=Candidatus Arthromitus sp. SFB-mouse TaxID=49118 RepID=UPI00021B8200|nr:glutamine amidotransferase [Candidatus Arthromitus sp. SFB-mouse]EIA22241.1 Glutamine amidotransferase, CobB/CobQ family [Candidatus Arthromitus sp. SFB-2]EIA26865.1 Glutamine amidotransferase, CobB/CobQ family [Candidatus Arthromitus sp. SFB-4]EIA27263.1 Glutamine amidotransferase, CobB/CobQ family [Candidatus Arthromitus sp. SFB-co]EIA30016.1 Glutamine amidotransferase, CobB/CobQ family [Candidatus Arthromitus sp. SFB-mouse-SU]EGX28320.1 CobB/CobQ family glutamine amidotransferase [Candid